MYLALRILKITYVILLLIELALVGFQVYKSTHNETVPNLSLEIVFISIICVSLVRYTQYKQQAIKQFKHIFGHDPYPEKGHIERVTVQIYVDKTLDDVREQVLNLQDENHGIDKSRELSSKICQLWSEYNKANKVAKQCGYTNREARDRENGIQRPGY